MINPDSRRGGVITLESTLAGIAALPPLEGHNTSAKFRHLLDSQKALKPLQPVLHRFIERKIGLTSPARFAAAIGMGEAVIVVGPGAVPRTEVLEDKIDDLDRPKGKTPVEMLDYLIDSAPELQSLIPAIGAYEDRARKYLVDEGLGRYLAEAATIGFCRLTQIVIDPVVG